MDYIKTNGPTEELWVPKDQGFADANILQHLPLWGIMQDALRHLYSGSRA
jgi:hypothetical protein